MALHGWLKYWAWLPVWFFKFEMLKFANSLRCDKDTYLKILVLSVMWKKQPESCCEKSFLSCWKKNPPWLFNRNISQKSLKTTRFHAKMSEISNSCVCIKVERTWFSVGLKFGRFIYAKTALIAFRNFLHHWYSSFEWIWLFWSDWTFIST